MIKHWKKIYMLFAILTLCMFGLGSVPVSHADEPAPKDETAATKLGLLAVGQDNLIYSDFKGDSGIAVGAGTDFARYITKFAYGGELDLRARGTIAAKVSGGEPGTIFAASATVDVIKLVTGSKIAILIPNVTLVVGAGGGYDVGKGRFVGSALAILNYEF